MKNASSSSPTDVGSHNPPSFKAQRPLWHSFSSPIDVGPPQSTPSSGPSVLAGTPPCVHLPLGLSLLTGTSPRERFPHLYKECFVLLPNRCGISQSTLFWGPASLLALVSFSNRCGIPQSTLLRGPTSLLAYCLVSTPLRGLASLPAHRLWRGFHILINNASFSSPTDMRSHNPPSFGGPASSLELIPFSNRCGISRSCWHTASCPPPSGLTSSLAHCPVSGSVPFVTTQAHR